MLALRHETADYRMMPTILRVGLLGFGVALAGCGSGDNSSGSGGADASHDVGTALDANLDQTAAPIDASESAAPSDAGEPDADDGGISFGDPICTPHSGTRIKAHWYQDSDGTRIFDSMWDSMLNIRCAPSMTPDGKLRCMPVTDTLDSFFTFSDSKCTIPLFANGDPCRVPPYVGLRMGSGCADGIPNQEYVTYQTGAPLTDGGPPYTNVYTYFNGTCTQTQFEGSTLYTLSSSPVPNQTFVEGVAGRITIGRYSMRTVQYNDGALFCEVYNDFFDSTLNVDVTEYTTTDTTTRLIPAAPYPDGYSDSTCMTPAAILASDPACAVPVPAPPGPYTGQYTNCSPSIATIHSVGAAIDSGFETAYAPDGGIACEPTPAPEGGTWNAVSATPLAPSTFGQTLIQKSGTGRLQYVNHAAAGGFRWRYNEAFDTQTNKICSVNLNGGATTPCVPFEYQAELAWSDSKCTQPLYIVPVDPSCTVPDSTATAWIVDKSCTTHIVHIGQPYTGTIYWGDSTNCGTNTFPGQTPYQGIDDIPPNTFESLTGVLE